MGDAGTWTQDAFAEFSFWQFAVGWTCHPYGVEYTAELMICKLGKWKSLRDFHRTGLGSVDCGGSVNGVRRTNSFRDGIFTGNQTELLSDLRSSKRRRREMFIAIHQSELPELLINIPPLRGGYNPELMNRELNKWNLSVALVITTKATCQSP